MIFFNKPQTLTKKHDICLKPKKLYNLYNLYKQEKILKPNFKTFKLQNLLTGKKNLNFFKSNKFCKK